MPQKIAIFGAGGFAREVLQVILDINEGSKGCQPWEPAGFLVDADYFSSGNEIHGLPVLESVSWLDSNPDCKVVIAVGSPVHRRKIANDIRERVPNKFATLVHPRAWLGRNVTIGEGSVICAGCLITTDIYIGEHVHINIGCTVGHDSALQDFATLNPSVNISGNVVLGQGAEIGTRSVLIPRANVGPWSIIGAGAVVTKALPSNVTAVGTPAKIIKERKEGWHISGSA